MYPLAPPETTVDAGEQEGDGLQEVARLTCFQQISSPIPVVGDRILPWMAKLTSPTPAGHVLGVHLDELEASCLGL